MTSACFALTGNDYVSPQKIEGGFCLVGGGTAAALYVDAKDHAGVIRAAGDLQADIERVSGSKPALRNTAEAGGPMVLIGTIGQSGLVDRLITDKAIDVREVAGKWETFLIQVVNNPLPGVDQALVIAGSDKRGTIYGIYDLSEQIGVSPWYWWADVPAKKSDTLFVKPVRSVTGEPAVKYRGIFINDEEPCFGPWARETFGGINSTMYAHMFELILRLRGNYLWPAMWGKSLYEDDPDSARLADEYGIMMGTSHHEPMTRAHVDWTRRRGEYGNGRWSYAANEEGLKKFWREGIDRNRDHEVLVTLGMRGDGDEPMIQGGNMEDNIQLLEKIIADQRAIIQDVKGDQAADVPLVWSLYKEVNDYYDHGMRVPDDITLLWCDDNWGNIRRLPTAQERQRRGGAGIYYHFDYVGGPRSYKWMNTNPLPKIWEQMNMAYEYGADRIWVVNVGDLKPMEIPIDFFLRMAWDPRAMPKEKIGEYTRQWAQREFGPEHADAIADIVTRYAKYNGWRKPELLEPDTFSLVHFREAERVLAGWRDITAKAEIIHSQLPSEYRDAYYQLVLYPTKASATVAEMYIAAGRNHLYAAQGRASANDQAQRVRDLFKRDQELTDAYHRVAGGKWNHMMAQTRIGFTSWRDPKENIMPKVTDVTPEESALMGVAIEGSQSAWPGESKSAVLPAFDSLNRQDRWIDVFRRGSKSFLFTAAADQPWVRLSQTSGRVDADQRIRVEIDWEKMPAGEHGAVITFRRSGEETVQIHLTAVHSDRYTRQTVDAFGGLTGPVAIAAEQAAENIPAGDVRWEIIPDYGRGCSGMAVFPVTAASVLPPENSPRLEYPVFIAQAGHVHVDLMTGVALPVQPDRGVRIAVSFNNQKPQMIDAFSGQAVTGGDPHAPAFRDWERWVRDNARTLTSTHTISEPGVHTLKIWMVDPGVVLEKLIVYREKLPDSYFGPPASGRNAAKPDTTAADSNAFSGAFWTGKYPNLFAEAGYSEDAVSAKVDAVYKQFFYGDPETEALYFAAGENTNGPLAYIRDIHNNDVRSEGMSYGMMIAVQLDKKCEFDALWNWARTYTYHDNPAHPAYGFFAWSVKTDGTPNDEMPAPDGEEYFAMALYFADARWGSGEGIYDYKACANRLLDDMKNRRPITGPTVTGVLTGLSLFDPDRKMVRFTPDLKNADHTDPSYHLPAFYELWALWGPPADRAFWHEAAVVSRDFYIKTAHPITGLTPEYAEFDGSPWAAPWKPDSVYFQYDAWRTAMNWSMDWAWWAADPRQQELSNKLQAFFHARGIGAYKSRYTLDGQLIGGGHSEGLVAMNAAASLAAIGPYRLDFVRAFWDTPVPTGRYRYYDGMLYMLGMLHCSGQFRIWGL